MCHVNDQNSRYIKIMIPFDLQDFSFALKLINEYVLKPDEKNKKRSREEQSECLALKACIYSSFYRIQGAENTKHNKTSTSKISSTPSSHAPVVTGTPIFIVPDALTAMFSAYNATEFLQDGTFIPNGNVLQRFPTLILPLEMSDKCVTAVNIIRGVP